MLTERFQATSVPQSGPPTELESGSESSDLDDEYTTRQEVEERLRDSDDIEPASASDPTVNPSADTEPRQKVGKAKAKRAKKLANQEKTASDGSDVS